MAMDPVITAIVPPFVRSGSVQIIGEAFGRVSSVALVDTSTQVQTECWFQVDTGFSIHFTIPAIQPDGTYEVLLGTLQGTVSTDTSGQTIVLPDDNPPVPLPGDYSQQNPIPLLTSPAANAIISRARMESGDFAESFSASVDGDGVTTRFDLPVEVIDTTNLIVASVAQSGITNLASGTDYTLDANLGVITLTVPLPVGSRLSVAGQNWQFFTTDDWNIFLMSAALKHTHNLNDEQAYRGAMGLKFYTVAQQTIDTLPPVEYHPVALLVAIEAMWVIATDATYDISVTTAESTSLPREQRFTNILQMIQVKTELYDNLCRSLGVGLNRIEVFTLRRVSRITNRLVPIYREKEVDDFSLPERIYVHRDSGKTANDTEAPDPYYYGYGGGVYP